MIILAQGGANLGYQSHESTQRFEPVAGATVKVDGTNLTATTDAEGRYTVTGVAAAGHKLSVSKAGFAATQSSIAVSPVSGLANVNVALQSNSYGLKQAPSSTRRLNITGVVSDPRGAALPGAEITANTSSGIINTVGVGTTKVQDSAPNKSAILKADADGYYSFYVGDTDTSNRTDEAVGPTQIRLLARGKTKGELEVELTREESVLTSPTEPSKSKDIKCLAFPAAKAPSVDGTYNAARGLKLIPGELARISVPDHLSSQADEFFIRIHTKTTTTGTIQPTSDSLYYDVLPREVTKNENGSGTIVFVVPYGIGDSNTVRLQLCQLGLAPAVATSTHAGEGLGPLSAAVSSFALSQADYAAAISGTLDGQAASEWGTSAAGNGSRYVRHLAVNPGIIAAQNEVATVSLELGNSDADVPVEVEVSFTLSSEFEVTGAAFGGSGTNEAITDATAIVKKMNGQNIDADSLITKSTTNSINTWTVKGRLLPNAGAKQRLDVGLKTTATAPAASNASGKVEFKDIKVTYPTRGFEKTLKVGTTAVNQAIDLPFYGSLINNAGYTIAKKYTASNAGKTVDVELTITPPASAAMQELLISDITPVEKAPVAASLTSSGTIAATAGNTGGSFVVTVAGVNYTVNLAAGTYANVAAIVAGLGNALAGTTTIEEPFAFTENFGKIVVTATGGYAPILVTTTSLSDSLRLSSVNQPVINNGEYQVEALGAASAALQGATQWSFNAADKDFPSFPALQGAASEDTLSLLALGRHTTSNSENIMAVGFRIVPPDAYLSPADRAQPIKVTYRLRSVLATPVEIVAGHASLGESKTDILGNRFKSTGTFLTPTFTPFDSNATVGNGL